MISRRNIRVKVMQTLYVLDADPDAIPAGAEKSLLQNLDQTEAIFIYLLFILSRVAAYSEQDAQLRASKRLAVETDRNVSTRIADNTIIAGFTRDPAFIKKLTRYRLATLADKGLIKNLYASLATCEAYSDYILQEHRVDNKEKQILLHLFNGIMMQSETLDQHLEDHFMHWPDDREMMIQLINNYLGRPSAFRFDDLISPEKREYARELLSTTLDKKEFCLEMIRPNLQHWDPDRIASIDMIIMQMGICEFLYFPTIPTKVSINEYIDVAKTYSTPESGHFVNGILDRVLKDLESAGKIQKTDRTK
jgi:N utilization substance protein B